MIGKLLSAADHPEGEEEKSVTHMSHAHNGVSTNIEIS